MAGFFRSNRKTRLSRPAHHLRRDERRRNALSIEALEDRQLRAASVTFDGLTGLLSIQGTAGPDTAFVQLVDTNRVEVKVEGRSPQLFNRAQVTRVEYHGGDGDDRFEKNTRVPSTVYGERGNDTLIGGTGEDTLHGGDDDDDTLIGGSETEPDNLDGYFVVIVRNEAIRIYRQKKGHVVFGEAGWDLSDGGETDASAAIALENREHFEVTMSGLKDVDQLILKMKYWNSMNFAEIGKILGMNEPAVRKKHQRALETLRDMLLDEAILVP